MGIILSAKLNSLNFNKIYMTLYDRFLELIQGCLLKKSQPNFISLMCFRAYLSELVFFFFFPLNLGVL